MNITVIIFGIGVVFAAGAVVYQVRKLGTDFDSHCKGGQERQTILIDKMESVKVDIGEKITGLDKRVFAIETVMEGRLKKRKK